MAYLKPSLALLGLVDAVVLGTGSSATADSGDEQPQPGTKAFDISAGLDD